ncbi:hypothetical protein FRC06_009306 [Ceratobasidium sp. 370]|nr:hypothetical protein FRC06_009306 [Ceratobasidium sp. 370]
MSSLDSAGSVDIADCIFCANHRLEVCKECEFDGREDNDTTFGSLVLTQSAKFDPNPIRGPLDLPATTTNKEGVIQCKKHANPDCKQCYGWKKQLTKLHKEAKKAR